MKISIITATWNSAETIRDTMESVLSQSYQDWEHIIVDGASKDATMDIVREMEPRYGGRLRYISEKDRGIYDAMNKGVAMASGDVVGILNSDDFFSGREVLATVAEAFAKGGVDAIFGDIHFVDCGNLAHCVRYYSSGRFARWQMLFGVQPAHPSFYCLRSVYTELGAFDTSFPVAADFEHMLRLIYVNRIRTRYVKLDFVTMRTGGASTSGVRSHARIVRDHYRAYLKHGLFVASLMDWMRYPVKLFRVAEAKIRYK